MEIEEVKKHLTKYIFGKIGHSTSKNASLPELMCHFDHINSDLFWDAAQILIDEGVLFDRGRGYVAFTPEGWDEANNLENPKPSFNQNNITIGTAVNSPVQQGIHSDQTQTTNNQMPSNEELSKLAEILESNLSLLNLDKKSTKKASSQIATIKAQLLDEPDPVVIQQAGTTLRNVTEGAIGSLVATAAQPEIWIFAQSILSMFP
jgi:hypothetical protein